MQTASHTAHAASDSENMVSWFINQEKAPLRVYEKTVDGYRYYLCCSSFENEMGLITVCGRGLTKLQAATRCIGEWLERKAAFAFFGSLPDSVLAQTALVDDNGSISLTPEKQTLLPLRDFWTTNGWAVHTDKNLSFESALSEALERSLLVASFLRWGWQGFIEKGHTQVDGVDLHSCLSRFKTQKYSAGFAISQSPVAQGLSFGHFADLSDQILQSPKWAHALYEAMDKFGADLERGGENRDPLAVDAEWFLKNKMDVTLAGDTTLQEKIKFSNFSLHTEDLALKWNLPFPLYSSFVFGGDLMPLFIPSELTEEGRSFVLSLANSLGFEAVIPERLPVL